MKLRYILLSTASLVILNLKSQYTEEMINLVAYDTAAGDYYGSSVSIDGDYVLVGSAYDNNEKGLVAGSAYLYSVNQDNGQWELVKKLIASDGQEGDQYGWSVSINGDYAIIGSIVGGARSQYNGGAYILYKDQGGPNQWGEVKKLMGTDTTVVDNFGNSVSLYNDYAIVGASLDDSLGMWAGVAYIFQRDKGGVNNWGLVKKLAASDGDMWDYYGNSVSIFGDYALVGAPEKTVNSYTCGLAYLYKKDQGGSNNWGQLKKFIPDTLENFRFGYSVDLSDSFAVVSKHLDDTNGQNSGSVYIFYHDQGGSDNWGQVAILAASDGNQDDDFGCSVSICGNQIFVGAGGDDFHGINDGSAYIFEKDPHDVNVWTEIEHLGPVNPDVDSYYGTSVDICNDYLIAGFPSDVISSYDDAGSVFIYRRISPIEIIQQPVNSYNACVQEVLNISVEADNVTSYQWQVSTNGGNSFDDLSDDTVYSNTGTAELSIFIIPEIDSNYYRCFLSNAMYDTITDTIIVTIDTIRPEVENTAELIIKTALNNTYTVAGNEFDPAGASDNCDYTLENDFNHASTLNGAILPLGSTMITWRIEDAAGNTDSCSFTVLVEEPSAIGKTIEPDQYLYPNPTTGIINLENPNGLYRKVEISNLSGRIVLEQVLHSKTERIDITALSSGVYFVKMLSDKGIQVVKIIKQD